MHKEGICYLDKRGAIAVFVDVGSSSSRWFRRREGRSRVFCFPTKEMNHEERLSKSLFTRFLHIAWRIAGDIAHRVAERLGTAMPPPFDGLHAIGVDETSHRKGHTYLTVVVDHERHRVIWAHDGVGGDVFDLFFNVFCQVGVGRFGVSFSPCERRVSGRFGVGRSCWLLVIALVIA